MIKFLLILFFLPLLCFGQKVKDKVNKHPEKSYVVNSVEKKSGKGVKHFNTLDSKKFRKEFLKDAPGNARVWVGGYSCLLKNIPFETNIVTDKGKFTAEKILNYQGVVEGMEDISLVAITVSKHEVSGFIAINGETLVIGSVDSVDIIYNDKDLTIKQSFDCGVLTRPKKTTSHTGTNSFIELADGIKAVQVTDKCINLYWEVRNALYLQKGAGTTAFITGLFNQVQTLYANDGIAINLKSLKIWTTPDPYTYTTDTYGLLYQFGDKVAAGFDGDFAQLIGYTGSGKGFAWINEYCDIPKYKTGVANIYLTYNTVPTWSWSVQVLAHELGHNLGSSHTHDCAWNGNNTTIDGCVANSGCPTNTGLPSGGGTIMSYCNMTSVGINFNNGFGTQPLAKIKNGIATASCLTSCSTVVTPPPTCSTYTETRTVACPTGQAGSIIESRTYQCPAGTWTGWVVNTNYCYTPPPPPPPTPSDTTFIYITAKIDSTIKYIKTIPSGYTNYKYDYYKNGVKQTWTTQTVYKKPNTTTTNYISGDKIKVIVTSSNPKTIYKWWIEGTKEIIIK